MSDLLQAYFTGCSHSSWSNLNSTKSFLKINIHNFTLKNGIESVGRQHWLFAGRRRQLFRQREALGGPLVRGVRGAGDSPAASLLRGGFQVKRGESWSYDVNRHGLSLCLCNSPPLYSSLSICNSIYLFSSAWLSQFLIILVYSFCITGPFS